MPAPPPRAQGKGAGDLETLHPINAVGDVGKGAAGTGMGKVIKKIF